MFGRFFFFVAMDEIDKIWTIGIDPDTDKSGVALLRGQSAPLEIDCLTLYDLLDYIESIRLEALREGARLIVYVEAGYLIGTVWHTHRGESHRTASAKGKSVGRNHQTARHIAEGVRRLGVETVEVKPLKKIGGRKADARLFRMITGYEGRTNQEGRDAGLIAYYYSTRQS